MVFEFEGRWFFLGPSAACSLTARPYVMNASQGLYAEILRTKAGLPVYIFGSDGVRSSQLSAAITPAERAALSGLSESDSEELATSPDYSRLAKLILDSISRAARRLSRPHSRMRKNSI